MMKDSGVTALRRRPGKSWTAHTEAGEVQARQVLVCVGALLTRVGLKRSESKYVSDLANGNNW
nr:hypothetical protein [Pseudomonas putida]